MVVIAVERWPADVLVYSLTVAVAAYLGRPDFRSYETIVGRNLGGFMGTG